MVRGPPDLAGLLDHCVESRSRENRVAGGWRGLVTPQPILKLPHPSIPMRSAATLSTSRFEANPRSRSMFARHLSRKTGVGRRGSAGAKLSFESAADRPTSPAIDQSNWKATLDHSFDLKQPTSKHKCDSLFSSLHPCPPSPWHPPSSQVRRFLRFASDTLQVHID